MRVTVLDLRRRMRTVISALDRNEPVTVLYRGRPKGVIYPAPVARRRRSLREHPAFGMWKDRADMRDVGRYVRRLRKGRVRAL
jgi:antitoxin (DNA-binding transcriptional repressor) of toxin-antitoxin stability system